MRQVKSRDCQKAHNAIVSDVLLNLSGATKGGKDALWLLSGGSAIDIEVEVASRLSSIQKKSITVGQVDERFVDIGSPEHNWELLSVAGFKFEDFADALPILQPNKSIHECASDYQELLTQKLAECDYALGIYGIGADGHTAGIKPTRSNDDFAPFTSNELVLAYTGTDFKRITTTAAVINKLDDIYVYCCGTEKVGVLKALKTDVKSHKMPAQLLKEGKNVVIFT